MTIMIIICTIQASFGFSMPIMMMKKDDTVLETEERNESVDGAQKSMTMSIRESSVAQEKRSPFFMEVIMKMAAWPQMWWW